MTKWFTELEEADRVKLMEAWIEDHHVDLFSGNVSSDAAQELAYEALKECVYYDDLTQGDAEYKVISDKAELMWMECIKKAQEHQDLDYATMYALGIYVKSTFRSMTIEHQHEINMLKYKHLIK